MNSLYTNWPFAGSLFVVVWWQCLAGNAAHQLSFANLVPSARPTPTQSSTTPPAPIVRPSPSTAPSATPIVRPSPTTSPTALPVIPATAVKVALRQISVRVSARDPRDPIGSGTIVGFVDGNYIVLTNAHVLRSDRPPYRITTPDLVTHPAKVINNRNFGSYDLALLQFRATPGKYRVAKIDSQRNFRVGDRLFVGGFSKQPPQRDPDDFSPQEGSITLVLNSPMDSGYRVGYSQQIYRGMSGGPILDRRGKLVGVNGLLNNPVWRTSTQFIDGTVACEPLQLLIDRSSFGITIDDIMKLMPRSMVWQIDNTPPLAIAESPAEIKEREVLQEAANKALNCLR